MYFGPKLGQGRHAGFRIRQGVMLVFSMRTAPPPSPFGDPKLYHCHYARHTNDSNSGKFDATLTELSVHSTSLTCRFRNSVYLLLELCCCFFLRLRCHECIRLDIWLGYLFIADWRVEQRIDLERTSPLF